VYGILLDGAKKRTMSVHPPLTVVPPSADT
jgi:hypothetical protein